MLDTDARYNHTNTSKSHTKKQSKKEARNSPRIIFLSFGRSLLGFKVAWYIICVDTVSYHFKKALNPNLIKIENQSQLPNLICEQTLIPC